MCFGFPILIVLFFKNFFLLLCFKLKFERIIFWFQFLCAFGLFIMIMGTYANLYLSEPVNDIELQNWKPVAQDLVKMPVDEPLKQVPPKVDLPSTFTRVFLASLFSDLLN